MEGATVAQIWREEWTPQEESVIWEWCRDNLKLPFSPLQQFDPEDIPQIKEVLEAMEDPEVRMVVLCCAVQTFKTLCGLLYMGRKAACNPGPMMWAQPVSSEALTFSDSRWRRMLEASPPLKALIPTGRNSDQYKKMWQLLVNGQEVHIGPSNRTFLQGKTVETVLIDECWQLRADDDFNPIKDAEARLTRFPTSKLILMSQGSEQGDPFDSKWKETDQAEMQFLCDTCGTRQPYKLENMEWESIKDDEGQYDFDAIAPTIRLHCQAADCERQWEDTPRDRRTLLESATWVPQNPTAPKTKRGFRATAYCNLSWSMLVEDYLRAKIKMQAGDPADMKAFKQKREGVMWGESDDGEFSVEAQVGEFTREEAREWEEEARFRIEGRRPKLIPAEADRKLGEYRARIMSVDVQRTGYYCQVDSYSHDGRSKRLEFRFVVTEEDVQAIQQEFEVHPSLVFVDFGDQQEMVLDMCCKHGWTGIRGDQRDGFLHNPKGREKVVKYYSKVQRKQRGKKWVRTHFISTLAYKDRLSRLLQRPDVYQVPCDFPEQWHKHLDSERRTVSKTGKPVWQKIGSRQDHGKDTACYNLAAAEMVGFFRADVAIDDESANDGDS